MKKASKNKPGLTIIELVITMSIFSLLSGIITVSLLGSSRSASLNSALTALISDIKTQQIKAVTGDTQGRSESDNYGIYFESNRYILFRGQSYNPSEPSNFTVTLSESLELANITFPSSTLVFAKGSGEVIGFQSGANSLVIKNNIDNQQKTITVNRLGVVQSVN